jgi:hypothetical protein
LKNTSIFLTLSLLLLASVTAIAINTDFPSLGSKDIQLSPSKDTGKTYYQQSIAKSNLVTGPLIIAVIILITLALFLLKIVKKE